MTDLPAPFNHLLDGLPFRRGAMGARKDYPKFLTADLLNWSVILRRADDRFHERLQLDEFGWTVGRHRQVETSDGSQVICYEFTSGDSEVRTIVWSNESVPYRITPDTLIGVFIGATSEADHDRVATLLVLLGGGEEK